MRFVKDIGREELINDIFFDGEIQPDFPLSLPRAMHPARISIQLLKNYRSALVGREKQVARSRGAKSRRDFISGRYCVRRLQASFGLPLQELIPGEHGPIWKGLYTGSISHSQELAVAILAHTDSCSAVGIDLERKNRVCFRSIKRIATDDEIRAYQEIDGFDWTLLFSAKESVFKALNPRYQKQLGLRGIDVELNAELRQFTVRSLKGKRVGKVVEDARGYWTSLENQLLTLVIVD